MKLQMFSLIVSDPRDLEAWVREDEETPVSACKSDEEIVAAVQSRGKTAASSEDESENEEDECEVEMPKIGIFIA